jgi:hypothetical protein
MKDIHRRKDKGVNNQESVEKIQNVKYNNSFKKEKGKSRLSAHKDVWWHGGKVPCINLGTRWRCMCASCFAHLTFITH